MADHIKTDNTIHIALFCPDALFDPTEPRALYSPARLEKLNRLRNPASIIESAAAELAFRAALRMAVEAGSPLPGERPWLGEEYSFDSAGRPVMNREGVFSADDSLFLSLAHTSGGSCAAVSARPVGVDAERYRALRIPTLLSLCPRETRALLDAGKKPGRELMEEAILRFSSRESIVKLTGGRVSLRFPAANEMQTGEERKDEAEEYCTSQRPVEFADGCPGILTAASVSGHSINLRVFRAAREILDFILA